MTRRSPETLSAGASFADASLSARHRSSAAAGLTMAASGVAARPKPTVVATDARAPGSRDACARCIAGLALAEVGHFNCRLTNNCRRCRFAATRPEDFTEPFCAFLRENPTVFHAVDYFTAKLADAGFQQLPARESWADRIRPGGKYWVARNGSSLIAFTVGEAYKPGNGVAMVAGHIDALTARLKPLSVKPAKAGFVQLGVAPYAGSLNPTWWDRDLSIGGRVIVRDRDTGKTSVQLVKVDWPVAKIPTLAPHFGVGMLGTNNKETQAVPILGLEGAASDDADAAPLGPDGAFVNGQPRRLVKLIARQLGIQAYDSIVNWELELYDSQPAQRLGLDQELITAGRIDDKLCSWAALTALLAAAADDRDGHLKLVALFDDEEIGSLLRQGARSNFLPQVIERTVESLSPPSSFGPGLVGQTYARSFLVSADVTHAGHPNFLENYLDGHVPQLNVGIAIAGDSNGHMTTDAVSTAILRRVAELCGARTQNFQIRNDSRRGGTIGPSLSSAMGVRAADAGLPQLSMHSVRATTGTLDPGLGVQFFKGFFDHWERIDAEFDC